MTLLLTLFHSSFDNKGSFPVDPSENRSTLNQCLKMVKHDNFQGGGNNLIGTIFSLPQMHRKGWIFFKHLLNSSVLD